MKSQNLKRLFNSIFQSASALAAILLLLSVLACSFNVGENGKQTGGKKSDTSSKAASDKRPSGIKKDNDSAATQRQPTGRSEMTDSGDFRAVYSNIKNPDYVEFNNRMKQQKVIEQIAAAFNQELALPTDVTITFKDCGQENAFYMPSDKSITMCYEFMDSFYREFLKMGKSEEEANELMFGATTFFLLHELGHCLIDVYDLPATGREEDSVDQLSTYILMSDTDAELNSAAIAGAMIFSAWAENEQATPRAFADEHSMGSQRFFNVACWMYGKDQEQYGFFVSEGILPEARAARCPSEYQKLSKAWERLVEPYRKK